MRNTRNLEELAAAMLTFMGCMNSPRQDDVLLQEAGASLDRALFALLVGLSVSGNLSVAELADRVGRDPSTVSRQLVKLEQLGLVKRRRPRKDGRVRAAAITKTGSKVLAAITNARRELLGELLRDWSAEERRIFPELLQRLADGMKRGRA